MRNIKEESSHLSEIAYHEIKDCIMRGEFSPDERLTEIRLSEMLGASRTPTRSAIQRLNYEGYVSLLPTGGFVISRMTEEDVTEILQVRCALECEAARMAAKRITEQQKDDLRRTLDRHSEILRTESEEERTEFFMQLDIEFHNQILLIAGNSRFLSIEDSLRDRLYRQRLALISTDLRIHECTEQHRNIANAIIRGDGEAASVYSRDHLMLVTALSTREVV